MIFTSFGSTVGPFFALKGRLMQGVENWLQFETSPPDASNHTHGTFHMIDCSVSPVIHLVSLYFCLFKFSMTWFLCFQEVVILILKRLSARLILTIAHFLVKLPSWRSYISW